MEGIGGRIGLLVVLAASALPGQTFSQGNPKIPPAEKAEIQKSRKGAVPRPIAARTRVPQVEQDRARVFKASRDSVVFIDTIEYAYLRRGPASFDLTKLPAGSGTGFVWDEQGYVVTNLHVITIEGQGGEVREVQEVQVTLRDGRTYKAQVVGRSLTHDIAVLKVFAPLDQMRPLPLGSTRQLEEGHSVLAIGNPFGLDHTLTTGVVSAKGRDIATRHGLNQGLIRGAIQTDAAINPGNSGGPLLDSAGRLVGMATAIQSTTGSSAGIGFAIPVETLNRVVPELIRKGRLERPNFGFDTLPDFQAAELGVRQGVAVDAVDEGSPAAAAGLRGLRLRPGVEKPRGPEDILLGDVIVAFNGREVEHNRQLAEQVELAPPSQDIDLVVLREGQRVKLTLKLKARRGEP